MHISWFPNCVRLKWGGITIVIELWNKSDIPFPSLTLARKKIYLALSGHSVLICEMEINIHHSKWEQATHQPVALPKVKRTISSSAIRTVFKKHLWRIELILTKA